MDLTNLSVTAAVEAAHRATPTWQALGFEGRKKVLKSWAKELTRNISDVAQLIADETGKPIGDATLEVTVAIEHLSWVAKNAEKILATQTRPSGVLFANIR